MPRTRHSSKTERRLSRERRRIWGQAAAIIGGVLFVAAIFWGFNLGPKITSKFTKTTGPKSYTSPPRMTIDTTKQYTATVKMAKGGEFTIELYAARAPVTVNNFVFLARDGFYDGTTFHRVLEGFMAQGGDPLGTGLGGPGYEFANEENGLLFDKPGVVAMANHGRDTNGSQFFITFGPADWLNGSYTIFGQVIDGMDVVDGLTLRDPQQNPDYPGDAIESITISEE
jgi:cyclophilin family peptidyl-prolyl cis-trans isomerase